MDYSSPNVDGDSPLHTAVRQSNLKDIRKILESQDMDVNVLNSKQETPLIIACALRNDDVIELLVAFGADPFINHDVNTYGKEYFDIQDLLNKLLFKHDFWIKGPTLTTGDTPLHTAVRLGRLGDIQKTPDQEHEFNRVNFSHETLLHLACAHGHKHIVHFLLSKGTDLYARDCYNNVPIHRAASQGYIDVVELLIRVFLCNPMIKGYQGRMLLHFACGVGNIELISTLIEKYGINPCATDAINQTPLHIAAAYGQEEVVCLLINRYNCPVDCKSNFKLSPLHLAGYCGHVSVVKTLVLKFKADMNALNIAGSTPFLKAVVGGNLEVVEMMITDFDVDPLSATDDSGDTPLHMVSMCGHMELARLLITKYNFPVDIINKNKETPLHLACLLGYSTLARMLVSDFKGNPHVRDRGNDTPINNSALGGHVDIVQMLITDFECSPQVKGFGGRSLLHQACDKGHTKLAVVLITDFNLDPLSIDDSGNTPLHIACICGHEELARQLITKYNCPVNIKNFKNQSPVLLACGSGHLSIVWMLVYEHKADLTACDRVNRGPLHVAALKRHVGTVDALITEFECNPHARGMNNKTILHYACGGGSTKLVDFLICDINLDPLCVDNDGNNPLHIAATFNWEEIVRLLIVKHKCPVNYTNKFGQTPLHLAINKGHINLCTTLISEFAADTNALDKKHETPLNVAIRSGNAKAVHILSKEFGCKPYVKGAESKPLLHQLAVGGYTVMLHKLIFKFNHDPASVDEDGNTLLHTAALYGQYRIVAFIISGYGSSYPVDHRNSRGQTPLHCACIGGNEHIAKLLVKNKSMINARDEAHDSPLKKAHIFGHTNVLSAILHVILISSYDYNIDSKLLRRACECGSFELIDVLIVDFKLNPCSVIDNYGNTPLHIAAYFGHKAIASLLIKHGCPVDSINFQGETPLHLICSSGVIDPTYSFELINLFISKFKADITKTDVKGDQPIHKSAQAGCTSIITSLVFDYGCDPHARGSDNTTLLHQALTKGHTPTANVLIEMFKLSIHSIDRDGNTPLHLSSLFEQEESVKLLLYNYHAPVFIRNKAGETAVDLANNNLKLMFKRYTSSKYRIIQAEYRKLWTLSSKKYSGQHNITRVFVLGYPGSGKSTLVESLKRKGIIASRRLVPEADVPTHTAGIVPSTHQSIEAGRLLYFDFAGDIEYYSSHSAILETVSHSSIGHSVYVIVANMTNDNGSLCNELGYWLSFISHHTRIFGQDKLKVIIVLSHSDLLTSFESTNKLDVMKHYLKSCSNQLNQRNLNIIDTISSNCRWPRSSKAVVDSICQASKRYYSLYFIY